MPPIPGFGPDFILSIAANLATDLLKAGSGRLRTLLLGTAEQRALQQAWADAFAHMLTAVAPPAADGSGQPDRLLTDLCGDIFRDFIAADGVAVALLDVALVSQPPPLDALERRFDALDFDRATLPLDFRQAIAALTDGLTLALLDSAMSANSPLHNRVNIVRLVAVQQLVAGQQTTLVQIAEQITRLEAQVRQLNKGKYTVNFLGPASGFAIGDGAMTQVDAGLRPLLEQVLAEITRLAAPPPTLPYTEADKAAYLTAVIGECDTIKLPLATGRASIPLREIYVALKADRSSPVERKASRQLFQDLVRQAAPDRQLMDEEMVYRLAALDPYAGRFLLYASRLGEELRAARQKEAEERTYDLAEILRQHRWLVLLGDPGSGKSTLARWLALHLALAVDSGAATVEVPSSHVRPGGDAAEMTSLGVARLPVLVRLADYAAARWPTLETDKRLPLRHYLGRHLGDALEPGRENPAVYHLIQDYLAAGRVTFILDGLDEVTSLEQRQAIAVEIEKLIQEWLPEEDGQTPLTAGYHRLLASHSVSQRGNQIIVTSRIVGYQLWPLHENLPHFVIQPMGDAAVSRFCHNWTAAMGLPDKAETLTQAVQQHPNANVREQMARNPLLLTILAQVFSADPAAGLPPRRAELYHQAQRAVFSQRRLEDGHWRTLAQQVKKEDLPRVLARLTAYVAAQLHANPEHPNSLVNKGALRGWLTTAVAAEPALRDPNRTPGDVVEDLLLAASHLSGFFVERGDGVYGFLHRQFQEYFAAAYLVRQMQTAPDDAARWQPVLSRLADPNWQEVLLLAAGILEREGTAKDVAALLQAMLDAPDPTGGTLAHNLLLTAAALGELENAPAKLTRHVAAELLEAYRRDDAARFAVLQKPVEAALARLPRPQGARDPVGDAFCQVLTGAVGDDEAGRFRRLAACDLILHLKWHTPAVAQAAMQAWRNYVEPAATLLWTLQQLHKALPPAFPPRLLPLRARWRSDWSAAAQDETWATILWALYLAPDAPTVDPEAILRDSPLTPGLRGLLTPTPADRESVVAWLREQWRTQRGAVQRDAGLALWYLGDMATLLPFLTNRDADESAAVLRRALVALTTRDRDLARARDLALARALDLDRALARALALDLDRARDLDRDLARDFDLARDLDLDHLAATLAEIEEFLSQAARRADLSPEMAAALSTAQDNLARLQAFVAGRFGLLAVWQAWGAALRDAPDPSLDWSQPGRLPLSAAAAAQLGEQLINPAIWPRLPWLDAVPLANLPDAAKAALQTSWQTAWWQIDAPAVRGQLALLLAETGAVTPETLPVLLQSLTAAQDLTRYRAQKTMQTLFSQSAAALERETIEALAAADGAALSLLADTYQGWALNHIRHDQPEWLQAWLDTGNTAIVGRIQHLTAETWPIFLRSLATAEPARQVSLLESASWLLREPGQAEIPHEALSEQLLALSQADDGRVQAAALAALGHWRGESGAILPALLALSPMASARAVYLTALARLAARGQDDEPVAQVKTILQGYAPQTEAVAALARLWVMQQQAKRKTITLTTLWSALGSAQANVTPGDLLPALLQAATDDDVWDSYHESIVRLIQELVQEEEGLLADLLAALQTALDGGEDDWPARRIVLAALASCAAVMPDAFNTVRPAAEVTALLIAGTEDAGSFNSRRHGILALSRLRMLTPAALAALLAAAHDVDKVQQDAITAAVDFRRLHPDFNQVEALDNLVAALHGESGAAAYLAAQVLAALGSSPAALQIPGLRGRIAQALSDAAQDARAEEMVYLLRGDKIEAAGTRAQVMLAALSQVWALPGR